MIDTSKTPLKLAQELSDIVNLEWENGSFLQKVTPTTHNLLNYWFNENFCDSRPYNFHPGQRQAILNAIYVHEILNATNVSGIYEQVLGESSVGDFINVPSKTGFEEYDIYYPVILRDSEEVLVHKQIDVNKLEPYDTYPLEKLKKERGIDILG